VNEILYASEHETLIDLFLPPGFTWGKTGSKNLEPPCLVIFKSLFCLSGLLRKRWKMKGSLLMVGKPQEKPLEGCPPAFTSASLGIQTKGPNHSS